MKEHGSGVPQTSLFKIEADVTQSVRKNSMLASVAPQRNCEPGTQFARIDSIVVAFSCGFGNGVDRARIQAGVPDDSRIGRWKRRILREKESPNGREPAAIGSATRFVWWCSPVRTKRGSQDRA